MGVPEFYQYISGRYLQISQPVTDHQLLPEFDNLYLDLNGIIQQCSCTRDDDFFIGIFGISEEQLFSLVFLYVDQLVGRIRPNKLLFLAVDGVVPRAKINQQRARRFRAAEEAKELRRKADMSDETLQKQFDSDCIVPGIFLHAFNWPTMTILPGTQFMAHFFKRLGYYVNMKITSDVDWKEVQVILSGPYVPGEGKHKIMEYIRLSRAQPGYNPNTRHCLYGLDADLIILALGSHEPHFNLLREELSFGPDPRRRGSRSFETKNSHIVHISLMRECLDIEFHELESQLPFQYNLENVIDDFILLAVLVGNDFLPILPGFHAGKNGLEVLLDIYKRLLPTLDGYLNLSGDVSLRRIQALFDEMAQWDGHDFEKKYATLKGLNRKTEKQIVTMMKEMKGSTLVLTDSERTIFKQVKSYVLGNRKVPFDSRDPLSIPGVFSTHGRAFIHLLAQILHLDVRVEGARVLFMFKDFPSTATQAFKMYESAMVLKGKDADNIESQYEESIKKKLNERKAQHYEEMLGTSYKRPDALKEAATKYVEGLLWVVKYYYGGVPSWRWFYNHYYAPLVSDLRGVDEMKFHFDIDEPFTPFEQLMLVLPPISSQYVPPAYRNLMIGPNSPFQELFPTKVELNLEGEIPDWDIVIKIPFIDDEKLLRTMRAREHGLTDDERRRNAILRPTKLSHDADKVTFFWSSIRGIPHIHNRHCKAEPFTPPTSNEVPHFSGLLDGVLLGSRSPAGFPSFKTLPHSATLGHHSDIKASVADPDIPKPRNKSILLKVTGASWFKGLGTEEIAHSILGKRIYTGWPFLREGLVMGISNSSYRYNRSPARWNQLSRIAKTQHTARESENWKSTVKHLESAELRRGILLGEVELLLRARPLIGITISDTGAPLKQYGTERDIIEHPVQMCLKIVEQEDAHLVKNGLLLPFADLFLKDTQLFLLADWAYGELARVTITSDKQLSLFIESITHEAVLLKRIKAIVNNPAEPVYLPSYDVAKILGISPLALSKITSTFPVTVEHSANQLDIGIGMKFDRTGFKVIDYTRKHKSYWEYSGTAVEHLKAYKARFPDIFNSLNTIGDATSVASKIFQGPQPEEQVKAARKWLAKRGLRNLPLTSVYEQLSESVIMKLEEELDPITKSSTTSITGDIMVEGVNARAVLKPENAVYRLQNHVFALGDRVRMVKNSGPVPPAAKGIVVGRDDNSLDVLWDEPFMLGTTLDGRFGYSPV
ncbi:hypothetical protein D9756_009694 [Leucocoprinus leucothites]|uniref:5'-3' exoribonuclease 1 n=1 Tax=Leucocoprinus leucothites TaxID=201217 RepID=A0A8H5CVE6_9AGAR|nr:hypothetical protein D9756_009694 [Leucoagaricus leucothites]